jgi:uncharacterized protein YdeI (YjbR/CyaY-like superfamily)
MAGAKGKAKSGAKSFRAPLVRAGKLGWTIAYLPFNVEQTWGTRKQIRVKGEINGYAFSASAFPTKSGKHFLLIRKEMQRCGHAAAGSTASFRLEPDLEERTVAEPKELIAALSEDKAVLRWYRNLSDSMRRYLCKLVGGSKSAAVRERRAAHMAEQLYSAMDAERELPPLMRRLMDEQPKSYAGWKKMTPTMRRGELLGIFHYKNPDSRERRIQKAIERMLERAEK